MTGGCFDSRSDLHIDGGDHQDQVKELIKETAGSLDNPELAMLFVSVQQNNLELCVRYAVNKYVPQTFTIFQLLISELD